MNTTLAKNGMLFDTTSADKAKGGRDLQREPDLQSPCPCWSARKGLPRSGRGPGRGQGRRADHRGDTPGEAAGARDPKLVENIALREFFRQEIRPEIGMEVNIKNRVGTVVTVTNRMVRVGLNRRFAGSALKYEGSPSWTRSGGTGEGHGHL